MLHLKKRIASMLLAATLCVGCVQVSAVGLTQSGANTTGFTQTAQTQTALLAASAPAIPETWRPVAPGTQEKRNAKAVIDYSNAADGYVMVQYTAASSKRIAVQVKAASGKETYTYFFSAQTWVALPLSDGSDTYQITLSENITATKYAAVVSATIQVTLKDEFGPFLHSNQYVNFADAAQTIAKAKELTADKGITDPLKKVEAVYDFVVGNLTYDYQLASSVKSGYLPVLDTVLSKKTGICFDYAALMTGMLRSQGVPCKLVIGFAGEAYHAWISVWTKDTGWIDGAIYFNGSTWERMDPTFASSSKGSKAIMEYIGDGKNYTAKYYY